MKRKIFSYLGGFISMLLYGLVTTIFWPDSNLSNYWAIIPAGLGYFLASSFHTILYGVIPERFGSIGDGTFVLDIVMQGKRYGLNGKILNIEEKNYKDYIESNHFLIAFNNAFIAKELKKKISNPEYILIKTIRHGMDKWVVQIDVVVPDISEIIRKINSSK